MTKAVVLLSGGQDSVTCLFWAKQFFGDVRAVSVYYGQRHKSELDAAVRVARLAEVPHETLEVPALGGLGDSALVDPSKPILAHGGYRDDEPVLGSLPTSFVPGRNALLLTLATAVAVKHGAKEVVTGVCQTDYSGYPDCRREFINALQDALTLAMPSSAGPIRIVTPLMWMTKAESVQLAHRLGPKCWAALGVSVTCYLGLRPGCGNCPACTVRARGFLESGLPDPAAEVAA